MQLVTRPWLYSTPIGSAALYIDNDHLMEMYMYTISPIQTPHINRDNYAGVLHYLKFFFKCDIFCLDVYTCVCVWDGVGVGRGGGII
jgi:hypothetical protein